MMVNTRRSLTAASAFGDTARYTAFLAALAGIYIGVDEGIAAAVGKDRCEAAQQRHMRLLAGACRSLQETACLHRQHRAFKQTCSTVSALLSELRHYAQQQCRASCMLRVSQRLSSCASSCMVLLCWQPRADTFCIACCLKVCCFAILDCRSAKWRSLVAGMCAGPALLCTG